MSVSQHVIKCPRVSLFISASQYVSICSVCYYLWVSLGECVIFVLCQGGSACPYVNVSQCLGESACQYVFASQCVSICPSQYVSMCLLSQRVQICDWGCRYV